MNKQFTSIHRKKPVRLYSGEKYKTNISNKKVLAVDFDNRCGYCGDIHTYTGGFKSYHVEHFAPKEKFSTHQFLYENLIYACPICNLSKSDTWVGKTADENIINGVGFIDPCNDDYDNHLYRKPDGSIFYDSSIGEFMYRELKLYLDRHRIIYFLNELDESYNKMTKAIEKKKINGKNYDKLEKIKNKILEEFFLYYRELSKNI